MWTPLRYLLDVIQTRKDDSLERWRDACDDGGIAKYAASVQAPPLEALDNEAPE